MEKAVKWTLIGVGGYLAYRFYQQQKFGVGGLSGDAPGQGWINAQKRRYRVTPLPRDQYQWEIQSKTATPVTATWTPPRSFGGRNVPSLAGLGWHSINPALDDCRRKVAILQADSDRIMNFANSLPDGSPATMIQPGAIYSLQTMLRQHAIRRSEEAKFWRVECYRLEGWTPPTIYREPGRAGFLALLPQTTQQFAQPQGRAEGLMRPTNDPMAPRGGPSSSPSWTNPMAPR